MLSSADSALASHWRRIATGLPDLNHFQGIRRAVAWLMAILLARHPDRMDDGTQFHRMMLRMMRGRPKNAFGVPLIEKVQIGAQSFDFDSADWDSYRNARDADLRRVFSNAIKPLTIKMTELLLRKTWTIVVSRRSTFVTSDRPVYYYNSQRKPFGLSTPGTIIFFPISPTRLLIVHDEGDGSCRYQHLRRRDELPFNFLTWVNARRFLISQFNPTPLLDKMVEESEKFDRIHANNRRQSPSKVGRNSPCPCGSGIKFKRCCGDPRS